MIIVKQWDVQTPLTHTNENALTHKKKRKKKELTKTNTKPSWHGREQRQIAQFVLKSGEASHTGSGTAYGTGQRGTNGTDSLAPGICN
jgi:hypothetical protein